MGCKPSWSDSTKEQTAAISAQRIKDLADEVFLSNQRVRQLEGAIHGYMQTTDQRGPKQALIDNFIKGYNPGR